MILWSYPESSHFNSCCANTCLVLVPPRPLWKAFPCKTRSQPGSLLASVYPEPTVRIHPPYYSSPYSTADENVCFTLPLALPSYGAIMLLPACALLFLLLHLSALACVSRLACRQPRKLRVYTRSVCWPQHIHLLVIFWRRCQISGALQKKAHSLEGMTVRTIQPAISLFPSGSKIHPELRVNGLATHPRRVGTHVLRAF